MIALDCFQIMTKLEYNTPSYLSISLGVTVVFVKKNLIENNVFIFQQQVYHLTFHNILISQNCPINKCRKCARSAD